MKCHRVNHKRQTVFLNGRILCVHFYVRKFMKIHIQTTGIVLYREQINLNFLAIYLLQYTVILKLFIILVFQMRKNGWERVVQMSHIVGQNSLIWNRELGPSDVLLRQWFNSWSLHLHELVATEMGVKQLSWQNRTVILSFGKRI